MSANTPTASASLRFGRFELQPHERRLLVEGNPVPMGSRALDLLHALAERAGQLVTKNALMDLVWPDVVVEENNLAAQISALRKVLGGDVISTIPGRGYRFTARIDAPLAVEADAPDAPQANVVSAESAAVAADARGQAAPPERRTMTRPQVAGSPTHLPAELTALLGRAEDEAALALLLDQHRLVSIIGAGGMGKTLLAQHLLDARRDAYPHGVCWVELAQVADAAALAGTIAAALDVQTGGGEPLDALVDAVAPLNLLLALDNAEHLAEAVGKVSQRLHDSAPGLRIVVTSQVPLDAAAEHVYRIGPLAVPGEKVPPRDALGFGSVALFVQRAQATDARFMLSNAAVPFVVEVCRALDGLPLAIELAASRAAMLGVQKLASSMRDRLRLLTINRNRSAPARQQTLRAALEWSYSLLDEREQIVFRRLAVIAGSAPLSLIQQVAADPAGQGKLDEWDVLDALSELVDRSLVSVLIPGADSEVLDAPRYRLLESARAFAQEELDAAGERQPLRERHARSIASMFDAAWDEHFDGSIGDDDWQYKMSFELDNAREAFAFAEETGDAALGLAVGATLLRAHPKSLPAATLDIARRCELMLTGPAPLRLRQRGAVQVVALTHNSGRQRAYEAAKRALALARELHQQTPEPFMLYLALCRFAGAAYNVQESEAANAAEAELLSLEDPTWPPQRLSYGLNTVSCNALTRGDVEEGLRLCRRAVALDRSRGAKFSVSDGNLIEAELAAGNAVEAVRLGRDLVAKLERSRDESELNYARLNLLAGLLALNECEQARPIARAGWEHAPRFWARSGFADYLALLAALEGRPELAAQLAGFADASYARLDERRDGSEAVANARMSELAVAALGQGRYERLRAEGTRLRDDEIAPLVFPAH